MIVVRDVFQIEFGKAKDAVAICKDGFRNAKAMGFNTPFRLMTDLVGDFYTLVFESTYESLAHYEKEISTAFTIPAWKDWYQKLLPYLKSGRREIFTIVD